MKRTSISLLLVTMALLAATGCEHFAGKSKPSATTKIAAPKPAVVPYILHTVKAGETMGTISQWYSGTVDRWREIAAANPQSDTNRLRVGEVLRIPTSMAVAHTEQPTFSTAPKRSKSKKAAKPKAEAITSEPVFGPK